MNNNGWISVEVDPIPTDKQVIIGSYYIDTSNGYFGASRWLWITQIIIEGDYFWNCFEDDEIEQKHMIGRREPTHWQPLPNPPN